MIRQETRMWPQFAESHWALIYHHHIRQPRGRSKILATPEYCRVSHIAQARLRFGRNGCEFGFTSVSEYSFKKAQPQKYPLRPARKAADSKRHSSGNKGPAETRFLELQVPTLAAMKRKSTVCFLLLSGSTSPLAMCGAALPVHQGANRRFRPEIKSPHGFKNHQSFVCCTCKSTLFMAKQSALNEIFRIAPPMVTKVFLTLTRLMARAKTSLPTPVSPSRITGISDAAALRFKRMVFAMALRVFNCLVAPGMAIWPVSFFGSKDWFCTS